MSILEQKLNAHLMQQGAATQALNPYQPTLREQINERIVQRESELERLRELSTLLEKNPDTNRLLELMRSVSVY